MRLFARWRNARATLALVVLTISLGAGVGGGLASALYGIYRGHRPGISEPASLAWLVTRNRSEPSWIGESSLPELEALEDMRDPFASVAAYVWCSSTVRWTAGLATLHGNVVLGRYFATLGALPISGRVFDAESEAQDGVVVISYALWERMGQSASVLGSKLVIDGEPLVVVGVMPRGFHGPDLSAPADFWIPIGPGRRIDRTLPTGNETTQFHRFRVIARLRERVSLAQAEAAASVAVARVQPSHTRPGVVLFATVHSAESGIHPQQRRFMVRRLAGPASGVAALLGLVVLNLAGLLTSRTLARRREIAVRLALGATEGAIFRMLVREVTTSVLLASAPAALLAVGTMALVPSILALSFHGESIQPPLWISFMLVLSLSAVLGVVSCVWPARAVSRLHLESVLRLESTTAGTHQRGFVAQVTLVGLQVALGTALTAGSLSFLEAARAADSRASALVELDHVAVATLHLGARYTDGPLQASDLPALLTRLRGLPGVSAVSTITGVPVRPELARILAVSWPLAAGAPSARTVSIAYALPGFFDVLGRQVIRGRDFREDEQLGTAPVAMVSELAARQLGLPGSSLGAEVSLGGTTGAWRSQVIGIVPDLGISDTELDPRPTVYLPLAQASAVPADLTVLLECRDPDAIVAALRSLSAGAGLGPDVTLAAETLRQYVAARNAPVRQAVMVLGPITAVSFFMAVLGVFGVIRGVLQRRAKETAIRILLGERPLKAVLHISRDVLVAVAAGIAGGVVLFLILPLSSSQQLSVGMRLSVLGTAIALILAGVITAVVAPAQAFWRPSLVDLLRDS